MLKGILILIVLCTSMKLIYQGIIRKANGPYSKEVELLWTGETCGSFGKVLVFAIPIILMAIINAIF